ncbi:MAG: PAS domain-containing protein [Candidatus Liptonbacteria bacterium]|nr:PAS domain-containing protein [Candidatus Liptonbacteria bacterium]
MIDTNLSQDIITNLLPAIPDGVFMFDRDQKVIIANPAATKLTGLPQEGFYLPEFTKLFKKRVKVDIDEVIKNVLSKGVSSHIEELSLVRFFYEMFISPTFDPAQNITGGVIVLHDITSIVEEKEKYRALLMGIGEGVIATNHEGKVVMVNPSAQDMLGVKDTELVGKALTACVMMVDEKGNSVPSEQHPIRLALSLGEKLTTTTYSFIRKNKTKFPVALTATPVILENKLLGAILVFRDITREKEIDRMKTEFVSLASHQLRTPLTSIGWYVEMLQSGDAGVLNDKQKKFLSEVYTGNKRMVTLVNALLNVSRLELGIFTVEPELTNVVELVQSVIDEQKQQINERRIRFSTAFEKDLPLIQADPKLLRMVVQNILSNAVKYTPEKGTINLGLRLIKRGAFVDKQKVNEDSIAIVVSDTGLGIPKNQQNQIFTKLFRADNVREKDTDGTGLGLYIVKSIVDHAGGKIWFESEENKGTTFYVILPISGMKKKEGSKQLS